MEAAQAYAAAHPYVPMADFEVGQVRREGFKPRVLGSEYLYTPFFDRPTIRVRLVHRSGGNVFLQRSDDDSIFDADDFAYYWPLTPSAGHAVPPVVIPPAVPAAAVPAAAIPVPAPSANNEPYEPNMEPPNSDIGPSNKRRRRNTRRRKARLGRKRQSRRRV
jgi:hypothetical protein